jgi:hypothetical protein
VAGQVTTALFVVATPRAAIFNFIPIFGPFFAPLKRQTTAHTNFWGKTILDLCLSRHKLMPNRCYFFFD